MAKKPVQNKHDRRRKQTKRPTHKHDDQIETAIPATAETPGQAESRDGFERFNADGAKFPWWNDYLLLRDEGFTWRVAAYIAWAAAPAKTRWPASQKELADQVLGLKSDQVIRRWRRLNPLIDQRVVRFQVEPLLRHRRDVIDALVDVASSRDTSAHSDRKLFLEMTGDYRPRSGISISGEGGGAVAVKFDVSGLPTDLLRVIADEGIAGGSAAVGAVGTGAARSAEIRNPDRADVSAGATPGTDGAVSGAGAAPGD
jgi:hypothetical protein